MSPVSKTELFKSVPLIIAVLVVAVGAYIVGHNATAQMVQASAQTSARNWADFIVQHAPQIDRVLEGAAPVELAAPFIRAMERSGSIKQYRIYDQFGAVRVDSTQRVWSLIAPGNQVRRNARAFDVLATNNAYFEFSDGISDGVKKLYARSFATMVKDGRTIGVIEVLSDETVNWNVLRGQLRVAGLQIIGLIVLAFVLPGMMYLRKSGQFEFAARRLKHTSKYDDLTGALNRSAFTVMIKDQIKSAGASSMSIAVHFIDMDRFKDVNDSRGHSVGDELLAQTGARLQKLLGIRESLARLGGDEFAICQPYFHNTPEAVRALADDVVREMAKPFNINGEDLQIGASVGYSHYPSDGETVAELFRTADVALYRAKDIKRGGALAFDQSMEAERKARQQIEVRLRSALANNEFEINYQPYFSADGTVLRGFEALLRLNDDNGKSISPAVFIPIAEDMGLIGEIGNWVLGCGDNLGIPV